MSIMMSFDLIMDYEISLLLLYKNDCGLTKKWGGEKKWVNYPSWFRVQLMENQCAV